ncbi:DUF402 domain-containing protein [Actinoplanes sp. NPDC023801]|uniref:DUF402 domain-containing protein n=1 Tax=Actinoplanes sp. NPDC023801 TaxID=3154595 RepID=UPI0033C14D76
MDRVELVLRKYDGRPHRRVTALRLGTDEFGTWLGTPRRTVVRYSYGWRRIEFTREDSVRLIPHDGWWMAMFLAEPSRKDVYCDITTPAEHTGSRITVIDLDIDLIRYRADHRVVIDDEDEFEAHRRRFGYPTDVVARATAATGVLHEALATAREPFGAHHHGWMTRLWSVTRPNHRRADQGRTPPAEPGVPG